MSQIGPKQTRAAHFLFPEQNTHTSRHTHNWENKNGPVKRGLLTENKLLLKIVSKQMRFEGISFQLAHESLWILEALTSRPIISKPHIRSNNTRKVTEVELWHKKTCITVYALWKWNACHYKIRHTERLQDCSCHALHLQLLEFRKLETTCKVFSLSVHHIFIHYENIFESLIHFLSYVPHLLPSNVDTNLNLIKCHSYYQQNQRWCGSCRTETTGGEGGQSLWRSGHSDRKAESSYSKQSQTPTEETTIRPGRSSPR